MSLLLCLKNECILFMPESTKGISEGQNAENSGVKEGKMGSS